MFSEIFSTTGILLLSINSIPKQETKATFFMAKNGNDAWSGKLSFPNEEKTDGPFATLARARDAVREIITPNFKQSRGALKIAPMVK